MAISDDFKMMIIDRFAVIILVIFIILNSLYVISLLSLTLKSQTQSKTNKQEKLKVKNTEGGTYKTKEEIEKAVPDDHPCNLTRTSVKISFPELRGELFVNLLGYKEPNLVHVMRCRGRCGLGETTCVATQVKKKAVSMAMSSHLYGKDIKQKYKDVTLEEHLSCGCRCNDILAENCAGIFNIKTCGCECKGVLVQSVISSCRLQSGAYWDYVTCQCKMKKTNNSCSGAHDGSKTMLENQTVDILRFTLLGSSLTLAIVLGWTTWQYRRKLRTIKTRPFQDSS